MGSRPCHLSSAQRAPGAIDRELAAIAGRQIGLITFEELLAAGLSKPAISRRIGRTLHRQHHRVYLYGNPTPAPGARELAAALSTEGVVSDRSAAGLWAILPSWPGDVHVTVPPGSRRRSRPGIVVHRRALDASDIRYLGPIPVTSPLRTLADLPRSLRERATNEALVRRLIEPADLPTHHDVTKSHAERRLLALLKAHGLSPDATNARVCGLEVDMVWRAPKLVLEIDGHAAHATPGRFEQDHHRALILETAGYRVLRVTWRQIRDHPARVLALIRPAAAPA